LPGRAAVRVIHRQPHELDLRHVALSHVALVLGNPYVGALLIGRYEVHGSVIAIHVGAEVALRNRRGIGAHGIETYSENNRGDVLAERIQRQIAMRVSTKNRGIRSAEFYVLRNCRLPAVLVECGFLTNPVEAQHALTPEYREQVAEQIAAGIIEQRQFSFPPLVPNHQGRLVHKTKKHRKVVDSERLVYPCATIPRERAGNG
jgi:hypothetical protein